MTNDLSDVGAGQGSATVPPEAADSPRPIAALQGAPTAEVQRVLAVVAREWRAAGLRVAGVIEEIEGETADACANMGLRSLSSGDRVSISQDLGPGSQGCRLDPGGLADACGAVLADLRAGCDVLVLSKFGKQEAAGSGMVDALRLAVESGVPVVIGVSPAVDDAWRAFVGPYACTLPVDAEAIRAWWRALENS